MIRAMAAVGILALAAGPGCRDCSTDEVHEKLTVPAGSTIQGESRSDDDYDSVSDEYHLRYEFEDLPDGFHFTVDEDYIDGRGHLVMVYTLEIEAWVPPDTYQFVVKYEIVDDADEGFFDWATSANDEVDFNFEVRVLQALGPAQRVTVKGVVLEDPVEEETRTLLLIE